MDLIAKIKQIGVENCMFLVPMLPVHSFIGISFPTSSDETTVVSAVVDEEIYEIEEDYKINLKSTDPKFGKQHFYVSDLEHMIKDGKIQMFSKVEL